MRSNLKVNEKLFCVEDVHPEAIVQVAWSLGTKSLDTKQIIGLIVIH